MSDGTNINEPAIPSSLDDIRPGHSSWIDLPLQWRNGETKEEFAARKLIPEEQELHRRWLLQYNISQRDLHFKRDMQQLAEFRAAQKKAEEDRVLEIRVESWRRKHPWQAFLNRHGRDRILVACLFVGPILIFVLLHLRWK